MKTLGLIGGIGPESTVEYYKLIIAGYRDGLQDQSYPPIIINSVDLKKFLDLITANEMETFTAELVREVDRLAIAGADFAAFAANTPHVVFDEVQQQSRIPLISIAEATATKAESMELKRVGLLGTRFTMQGRFYPDVFSRAGIKLFVPDEEQQVFIHEKYIGELLNSIFLPETRTRLLAIADDLTSRYAIEALILAGTELPLLLRGDQHNGIPLLDTTRIHVDRIVRELLS